MQVGCDRLWRKAQRGAAAERAELRGVKSGGLCGTAADCVNGWGVDRMRFVSIAQGRGSGALGYGPGRFISTGLRVGLCGADGDESSGRVADPSGCGRPPELELPTGYAHPRRRERSGQPTL